MSESIQSTLISALPAATKVSDTDIVVLENGSTTQKITIWIYEIRLLIMYCWRCNLY